jgi:hypothetical protein
MPIECTSPRRRLLHGGASIKPVQPRYYVRLQPIQPTPYPCGVSAAKKKVGIGAVPRMVKIKSIERVGLYLAKICKAWRHLCLARDMS